MEREKRENRLQCIINIARALETNTYNFIINSPSFSVLLIIKPSASLCIYILKLDREREKRERRGEEREERVKKRKGGGRK
jgi:hypothetical protein